MQILSAMEDLSPKEAFRPPSHEAPTTTLRRSIFQLRLMCDLQTNTIYRDLRRLLPGLSGRLLDVGCGNSPFRHLLNPAVATYQGVDVREAVSFGYRNPETIYYDGEVLPFPDESFDALLCTEVLEHVADPSGLIQEMYRVLKKGGLGIVTIPWSARFHYQPIDFHRYTPSMLDRLFAPFSSREVSARGTDFSSIASKVVVAFMRNMMKIRSSRIAELWQVPLRVLVAFAAIPVLVGALALGHCGILFGVGSTDDPLGYTVLIRK